MMADINTKESSSVEDDDIDAIPENSLPHFPRPRIRDD